MTRDEKIKFIIQAVEEVEDAIVGPSYYESYTDKQLDKEVVWLQYILGK